MNLYLVTGTTTGIGAALRDALAADPANCLVTLSRAAENGKAPVNIFLDLAKPETIAAAFGRAMTAAGGGRFERAVLINNAGVVGPVGRFDRIDGEALQANLQVNLVGPMQLATLFANATRSIADRRLIVHISSGAAKRAIAGWSAYCVAKAGLEMAARVAALEAAQHDPALTICSLAPGVVDTPMQGRVRATSADDFPDVERFRGMKADGALRPAADVAQDIIRLIHGNRLENGGNHDIREMLHATGS
ncbi:MAG: SDR family NAD(P)-dependent oxidoreductase [Betaproteobacteria bacterium]|nr:SDR family NAD(P)-dependent oxidoreductase [Betaproteobacteria bacterium]